MTRYLLDTNIVSELRKRKPHGAVVTWFSGLLSEQIFISAVTVGELQAGAERTRLQDRGKASEIEQWINELETALQVIAMDSTCFREWGRITYRKSGHLLEDAMIAATARVHGLTVATRNERDFRQLGVVVLNPFQNRR